MLKSTLVQALTEVNHQLESGKITPEQHEAFMKKARDLCDHTLLDDPVWVKKRRPITAPRAHKNGAWKKYLQEA